MVVKYIKNKNNIYPIGVDWSSIDEPSIIDGVSSKESTNITHYEVCLSDSETIEKEIPCQGFNLIKGAKIAVKFKNNNTTLNPMLKVGNTTSAPIYYKNANIEPGQLIANVIYEFIYNGEQYELVPGILYDSETQA